MKSRNLWLFTHCTMVNQSFWRIICWDFFPSIRCKSIKSRDFVVGQKKPGSTSLKKWQGSTLLHEFFLAHTYHTGVCIVIPDGWFQRSGLAKLTEREECWSKIRLRLGVAWKHIWQPTKCQGCVHKLGVNWWEHSAKKSKQNCLTRFLWILLKGG